jgi:hypothetical protein
MSDKTKPEYSSSRSGTQTSEFKLSLGIILGGLAAGVATLATLPVPPLAVYISTVAAATLSGMAYASSRGKVKAAVISAGAGK